MRWSTSTNHQQEPGSPPPKSREPPQNPKSSDNSRSRNPQLPQKIQGCGAQQTAGKSRSQTPRSPCTQALCARIRHCDTWPPVAGWPRHNGKCCQFPRICRPGASEAGAQHCGEIARHRGRSIPLLCIPPKAYAATRRSLWAVGARLFAAATWKALSR